MLVNSGGRYLFAYIHIFPGHHRPLPFHPFLFATRASSKGQFLLTHFCRGDKKYSRKNEVIGVCLKNRGSQNGNFNMKMLGS